MYRKVWVLSTYYSKSVEIIPSKFKIVDLRNHNFRLSKSILVYLDVRIDSSLTSIVVMLQNLATINSAGIESS